MYFQHIVISSKLVKNIYIILVNIKGKYNVSGITFTFAYLKEIEFDALLIKSCLIYKKVWKLAYTLYCWQRHVNSLSYN